MHTVSFYTVLFFTMLYFVHHKLYVIYYASYTMHHILYYTILYRGQGRRVEDRYSGPINRRQRIYTGRKYTGIFI